MSQMTAARVAPRPARTPARTSAPRPPRLRLVDARPAQQSHVGFVVLCAGLVLAGLIAALLLNTVRAEGSFVLSDLRAEATLLHDTKVTMQAELAGKRSPEGLAAEAKDLGMVPSPSTAVLHLSDGSVTGVAAASDGARTFTVETSSPGTPAESAGTEDEDLTKEG